MVARTKGGGVKASARHAARAAGHTLPGTDKFPIVTRGDVANAKHRIGSTTEPRSKVVAYINRRARALGVSPVGGAPPHHFAHGRPRTD